MRWPGKNPPEHETNSDLAAIARKHRGGEDWYLGAITDELARAVTVKLDFLSPGKSYTERPDISQGGAGGDGEIRTRGGGYPPRRFSKPLVSATHPRLRLAASDGL